MAKDKEIKTNAMRQLEKLKIPYTVKSADIGSFVSGVQAADLEGMPHDRAIKTLVAEGKSRNYHVFMIPIEDELDLKKAARAAGEKSVTLIPVKDITKVTGYVRGGVSPLGMKKVYPTYLEEKAAHFDEIYVSAGKIGVSVCLTPKDLMRAVPAASADLCAE